MVSPLQVIRCLCREAITAYAEGQDGNKTTKFALALGGWTERMWIPVCSSGSDFVFFGPSLALVNIHGLTE